jgi:hypothetical protein
MPCATYTEVEDICDRFSAVDTMMLACGRRYRRAVCVVDPVRAA